MQPTQCCANQDVSSMAESSSTEDHFAHIDRIIYCCYDWKSLEQLSLFKATFWRLYFEIEDIFLLVLTTQSVELSNVFNFQIPILFKHSERMQSKRAGKYT